MITQLEKRGRMCSVTMIVSSSMLLAIGVIAIQGNTIESFKTSLIVNKIVDGVLKQVRKTTVDEGYDPMPLPDYEASFSHIGLLGKLELTHCKLHQLSTVYRSQDVTYRLQGLKINFQTALAFDNLKLNCSYEASILGLLRKKGEAVVKIPNLSTEVDMNLILNGFTAELNDLRLVNKGPIDVHLEGGLIDALASIRTQTISNLFKDVILNQVEQELEDKIRESLKGPNEIVKEFLISKTFSAAAH